MSDYTILDEFGASFVYDETLYYSEIKYLDYKSHKSFRVEYTCKDDDSKGVIPSLYLKDTDNLVWDCEGCSDKELCKTIGHRIAMHYFCKNVLKI